MMQSGQAILNPRIQGEDAPWGGKGRALFRLAKEGFEIPAWFAISPEAYSAGGVGSDLRGAIASAVREIAPHGQKLAVRSSASDEDGAAHSFAGQLESVLHVRADEVAEAVEKVWRSGFSERVKAYRRERGLGGEPSAPTVIVQKMVEAQAAGVAFSVDPVGGDKNMAVVSAVRGVGDKLVSGEVDADTWHLSRDGNIVRKYLAGNVAVMGDEVAAEVAELSRRCEKFFGTPQDIEWAMEEGKVYLLQSRAITTIAKKEDAVAAGAYQLWDNSNIAESYGGVTTPMTFSFARHAYDGVYREFCRVLGVSRAVIAANEEIFPRMLGMIRGRVYYNLLNWYRLLAMLPGYRFNRKFMEQMMGVKEGLPQEAAARIGGGGAKMSRGQKLVEAMRVGVSVARILFNHFTLRVQIRRFYRRLNEALGDAAGLREMRADELVATYRALEKKLLSRWDAPLVNDFFAMIFYGSLRKSCENWCGDGSLQNDLLANEGGMISAEPARRVSTMADLARGDEKFAAMLREGSAGQIEEAIENRPSFAAEYRAYLDKFADRCLEELKLESETLDDDPLILLRSIGHLAGAHERHEGAQVPATVRAVAELCVRERLKGHPIRRVVFNWVLKHARQRVRDRENLRFERTRVFGRVRRILLELGERFVKEKVLDEARDVFWLELEEVIGFVEGTASSGDLRAIARVRKEEFEKYRAEPPPPSRFATRGMVNLQSSIEAASAVEGGTGEERKGIACCPGRVRAAVCVVRDPRGATLPRGRILVAERTDPGWIMLFPSAAGLLVERGSLLSHSAIVSRELGIPSIVSIPGLMEWLADGDEVEMDGGTGIVRRVSGAAMK